MSKYIQFSWICLFCIAFACTQTKQKESKKNVETQEVLASPYGKPHVKQPTTSLQYILDSADMRGTILIYDIAKNIFYSNDFNRARQGFLPASTYKIPNSIIALETGVVENDSTIFEWDGKERYLKVWEQDLIFREAFHVSCVPCYQEIARKIGVKRMEAHLQKFEYGDIQVDSSNIDRFWLEGDAKISPFQQIDFLSKFYHSKLPISERTQKIMKRLMVIDETDAYVISGKTGWAIRNGNNTGWFVGYLETEGKIYFFATNVEPNEDFNMKLFPKIRSEVTMKAFKLLEVI